MARVVPGHVQSACHCLWPLQVSAIPPQVYLRTIGEEKRQSSLLLEKHFIDTFWSDKESTTSKSCKMAVNSLGQNTRRKQGSSLRNAESPVLLTAQSMTWCGKYVDTLTSLSQEWARKVELCMGIFFLLYCLLPFFCSLYAQELYMQKKKKKTGLLYPKRLFKQI